jgi:hypothetical protein
MVVEKVLDGDLFSWGVLMHTKMMSQLNQFQCADSGDFVFGSGVLVAWFLKRVPLLHPCILLEPMGRRESPLMWWAHMLAHHEGGEGCLNVASYATCDIKISICGYGLLVGFRHGVTS